MKRKRGLMVLALALLGIVMAGLPAAATTIKSASHYGPNDPGGVLDCLNSSSACEAVQDTGLAVTINGNNYEKLLFTDGSGLFDVFDFGKISADTLLNLPFASWGVLTCGDGDSFDSQNTTQNAFDSGHQTVNGLPCTQIDKIDGIPLFGGTTLYSTTDFSGNGVAFTILANGSIRFNSDFSDVVFFTPDTTPVATPEPGSLALLGTGMIALWGTFRRRKQA